jgi:HPt (histidine-containing phosphotransfer) domain-containing protein
MPDRQSVASDEPHGQSLLDPSAMAQALQAMPMSELRSMIDDYLQQGPDTVQRLRAAIRDAQALDLRAHAHAAKGAALNLGLVGLAATAQALQVGADHLPAHEIARLVQRFEQQLLATRQALGPALELARARAAALDPSAHSAADYTMMGSGSSRMPKRP